MQKRPLSLVIAIALLAIGLGASSSGCFYIADSVRADACAAGKLPEAVFEGTKRDFEVYQPVPTSEPAKFDPAR